MRCAQTRCSAGTPGAAAAGAARAYNVTVPAAFRWTARRRARSAARPTSGTAPSCCACRAACWMVVAAAAVAAARAWVLSCMRRPAWTRLQGPLWQVRECSSSRAWSRQAVCMHARGRSSSCMHAAQRAALAIATERDAPERNCSLCRQGGGHAGGVSSAAVQPSCRQPPHGRRARHPQPAAGAGSDQPGPAAAAIAAGRAGE